MVIYYSLLEHRRILSFYIDKIETVRRLSGLQESRKEKEEVKKTKI
jgi:hypothetical protein